MCCCSYSSFLVDFCSYSFFLFPPLIALFVSICLLPPTLVFLLSFIIIILFVYPQGFTFLENGNKLDTGTDFRCKYMMSKMTVPFFSDSLLYREVKWWGGTIRLANNDNISHLLLFQELYKILITSRTSHHSCPRQEKQITCDTVAASWTS